MRQSPKILFEDTHLAVVSKPAGLLSQGDKSGDASLVDWLRDYFGRHYVGLVHRLDRNVSGLMVVAKRSKSANRLSESLRVRNIKRNYQALVYGTVSKPVILHNWLIKDERFNKVKAVSSKREGAREAVLEMTPKKAGKIGKVSVSLVEVHLKTGRSHQIRVQLQKAGFPMVGDVKYGLQKGTPGIEFPRPALHAYSLEFPHPMSKEIMQFKEKLPSDMDLL